MRIATSAIDRLITQQAATLGVNDVFFALGCLYFLLIPFVWLAKPPFVGGRGGAARMRLGTAIV
jgi:DHA2 family multidrug resistance protein